MNGIVKQLRYYYWLATAFFKKNVRWIILSFVMGFFIILFLISFFPLVRSILSKRHEIVGIVGEYTVDDPPDEVAKLISTPLITVNGKGEIIPLLANSWRILNNNKTYRFYLKGDVFWNNNKRFTSQDINYVFKGITIKTPDATTIEFDLNQPLAIFPVYLTKPILRYPLIGVGGFYKVQSYKTNKNHLREINLLPQKEGLPFKTYRFFPTEDALITAYKKGEVTTFKTNKKNVADLFSNWKNTAIDKAVDYSQIITIFFNTESGLLSSRDVRRALAYATAINKKYGDPAQGPIPPTSWAFSKDPLDYPFDPEKAKKTIEKNKSATEEAELSLYTFYDYISIAEDIKKDYENVGLKINLKVLSYIPQQFDMLLSSWNPPQDPDQYFFWHSTQKDTNITNYKNVKVDKYLEDGRKTVQIPERLRIYRDFQRTIMEDVPAYFLYYPVAYTIHRK